MRLIPPLVSLSCILCTYVRRARLRTYIYLFLHDEREVCGAYFSMHEYEAAVVAKNYTNTTKHPNKKRAHTDQSNLRRCSSPFFILHTAWPCQGIESQSHRSSGLNKVGVTANNHAFMSKSPNHVTRSTQEGNLTIHLNTFILVIGWHNCC